MKSNEQNQRNFILPPARGNAPEISASAFILLSLKKLLVQFPKPNVKMKLRAQRDEELGGKGHVQCASNNTWECVELERSLDGSDSGDAYVMENSYLLMSPQMINNNWKGKEEERAEYLKKRGYLGNIYMNFMGLMMKGKKGFDEVVCFPADNHRRVLELDGLEQKVKASRVCQLLVKDSKEEFVKNFILPCLRDGAVYRRKYLLWTSKAHLVIKRAMGEVAKEAGADAVDYQCTGTKDDQVHFELTLFALNWELMAQHGQVSEEDLNSMVFPISKKSKEAKLLEIVQQNAIVRELVVTLIVERAVRLSTGDPKPKVKMKMKEVELGDPIATSTQEFGEGIQLVDFGPYQILDEDRVMASRLPYSYLPFRMLTFHSIHAENDLFPFFLEDKEAYWGSIDMITIAWLMGEDEAYEVCWQSLAKEQETGESTLRLTHRCLLIIALDVLMRVLRWIRGRTMDLLLEASVRSNGYIRSETEAAGEGERVLCLNSLSVVQSHYLGSGCSFGSLGQWQRRSRGLSS